MPTARRFRILLGASVAWTLFVWGTRINNALGDDALSSGSKAVSIGMAAALILLALAAASLAIRTAAGAPTLLRAFLAATVVVWAIRVPQIWLTEHPGVANPTAFNLVHTVLGVISIGLAALVWRSMPAAPVEQAAAGVVASGESPAPAGHR